MTEFTYPHMLDPRDPIGSIDSLTVAVNAMQEFQKAVKAVLTTMPEKLVDCEFRNLYNGIEIWHKKKKRYAITYTIMKRKIKINTKKYGKARPVRTTDTNHRP